ncbi:MAG: tRNA pseudouridine(55) synthase TruB [Acholeplasmataceae bacterium]|nr:tRNA pseudouridine(55) synthase TruB [Acholeplasmataceae bacterium]
MDGFLYVDKPVGMTSHDVVAIVKKKLKLDKVGHTGTLDPFASGLMILCVGKATKLAYLFSNCDKTYTGTMHFGVHYDTYDVTGKLLEISDKHIELHEIENAMKSMVGTYNQLPPMYSAIKKDGQKLYELARKGMDIEREKREVHIHSFEITSGLIDNSVNFAVSVSKGTYIRSLAVDLAEKMNHIAALSALKRTKVCDISVLDAHQLDDIKLEDIMPLNTYFKGFPRVLLNDYMINLVRNGVYLDERQLITENPFIVVNEKGDFIAYYEVIEPNKYKPIIVF